MIHETLKIMAKVYNKFSDIYGNEYGFETYMEFATFWFGNSYQNNKRTFPNFVKLQNAASDSREARKKMEVAA